MVASPQTEPAPVGSSAKQSLWKRVIPTREKAQTLTLAVLPSLTVQEFFDFLQVPHGSNGEHTTLHLARPLGSMPWVHGDLPRESTSRLCRILTDGFKLDARSLWKDSGDAYNNVFQREVQKVLLALEVLGDSVSGRPLRRSIASSPLDNFAQAFVNAERALLKARQTDEQFERTRHDSDGFLAAYAERLLRENRELLKRIRLNLRQVGQWAGSGEGVSWRHAANDIESKLYTNDSREENAWVSIMKGQLHLELLTQVHREVEAVSKFDSNASRTGELSSDRRAWLHRNAQKEYSRKTGSRTADDASAAVRGLFERNGHTRNPIQHT